MRERETVEIRLGRRSDGSFARDAAFMVIAKDADRCGLYKDEPAVIAQIAENEERARFEATWDGKKWKFGSRVQDA
jgi:hypothetical protein